MNMFQKPLIKKAIAIVLILPLLCVRLRADDVSDHQGKLNDGYYLLHHLSYDEAQLPLLLDMKHATPETTAFADRISKLAKLTNAELEKMQSRDPKIKFGRNPLPAMEQDVRDSITAEKQHQLLFGTSNNEFLRACS